MWLEHAQCVSVNTLPIDQTEPAIQDYLNSLFGYRKNVHEALDASTKTLLARKWNRTFREWGCEAE